MTRTILFLLILTTMAYTVAVGVIVLEAIRYVHVGHGLHPGLALAVSNGMTMAYTAILALALRSAK